MIRYLQISGGQQQAVVSLDGSVAALTFDVASTEGTAWLLLEDHSHDWPGEPGRPCPESLMGERELSDSPGVLIGTKDSRSLDVIIDALTKLRDELRANDGCCPAREGEIHCEHWWNGDACCSCGDPGLAQIADLKRKFSEEEAGK